MLKIGEIITVGLCPAWDTVCVLDGVEWGEHAVVAERRDRAAGKALNVSRALAWTGEESTAAGLWGTDDYSRILEDLKPLRSKVKVRMTAVPGATRQNITVVDRKGAREMHLRNKCNLASKAALAILEDELETIVSENSVCVFAGSMPEGLDREIIDILDNCADNGALAVVDTSGPALGKLVGTGAVWMAKPNVRELGELVGFEVADDVEAIRRACAGVLEKVEIVLVSRGENGAVAVTEKGVWEARAVRSRKAISTVGCGDYLLAGFLKGMRDTASVEESVVIGIKAASAKAWGVDATEDWAAVSERVEVRVKAARGQ
jgi:1-phosphofructokinase